MPSSAELYTTLFIRVNKVCYIRGHIGNILSLFFNNGFVILQAGERRRKIRLHRCLRCRRPGSWNDPGKASGCHCLIPFLIFPLPSSTSAHSSPIYFPILREENYFILQKNTTKNTLYLPKLSATSCCNRH